MKRREEERIRHEEEHRLYKIKMRKQLKDNENERRKFRDDTQVEHMKVKKSKPLYKEIEERY